jgi:hypothetical protein
MDAVQSVLSLVAGVVRAPADLEKALQQLETMQLPSARLLIDQSDWCMFKNNELDKLIWQLQVRHLRCRGPSPRFQRPGAAAKD